MTNVQITTPAITLAIQYSILLPQLVNKMVYFLMITRSFITIVHLNSVIFAMAHLAAFIRFIYSSADSYIRVFIIQLNFVKRGSLMAQSSSRFLDTF